MYKEEKSQLKTNKTRLEAEIKKMKKKQKETIPKQLKSENTDMNANINA